MKLVNCVIIGTGFGREKINSIGETAFFSISLKELATYKYFACKAFMQSACYSYSILTKMRICPQLLIKIPNLLCYLLIPWSRVLPAKLKRPKLLKKFSVFCGTRKFITVFTKSRHLFLSWARLIQSVHPHPTSRRSVLILSSHLRLCLPSGLLPPKKSQTQISGTSVQWE